MSTLGSHYSSFHGTGGSVRWVERAGIWFVAGYAEVRSAARAESVFSSRHDLPTGSSPYRGVMIPPIPIRGIPLELDGAPGAAVRRLLRPFFSLEGTATRAARIDELTNAVIDRHLPLGRMDLFHDLAKIVPATIILEMLGVPVDAASVIADAVHVRGEARFGSHAGWDMLRTAVDGAIARRRRDPAEDVISVLLASELDGDTVADETISDICYTLVIGGMSTTAKVVLGALAHLGSNIEDRQRLVDDPSARAVALEEFLRYVSPVPVMARTAVGPVTLGECAIAAGDRVVLGFGAANHDPRVFEEPECVRIDRAPNRHIAMGLGPHACLGAALGRLEATIMIDGVLDRLPDYALAESPAPAGRLTVRPESMPVTFSPRVAGAAGGSPAPR